MKNKIWERVVTRYKDEASIKEFLIRSFTDVFMIIGVAVVVLLIKLVLF